MEKNNQEIEEWRSIEGYEGLYEVSNLGRVRSLDKLVRNGTGVRLIKGRILRLEKDIGGYLVIRLSRNSKNTKFFVHRLVGIAFQDICGKYMEVLEIDHRNTSRTDNRAVNLHWVTRKENCNNPITRQNCSNAHKGEKCCMFGKFGKEHNRSKPIIQYSLSGTKIGEFEGTRDAERKLGIFHTSICQVLKGRRKTAGGFIFKYKTA